MNSHSLRQITLKIPLENLNALLLTNQSNIRYLTSFAARESYLLITENERFFITDFRYAEEARKSLKNCKITVIRESLFETVSGIIRSRRLKRIGFEARSASVSFLNRLKKISPKNTVFRPTAELVESMRQIKTENEIKMIMEALKLTGKSLASIRRAIHPGVTELELEAKLEYGLKRTGVKHTSFDTIIAFGKNASMPHHITSNKKLSPSEAVLIDMGVEFNGYKSDITRTFALGCKKRRFFKAYDTLRMARETAFSMIKPGTVISDIDNKTRAFMDKRGFGRFFGHSLGHGVGLDVHELPGINHLNSSKLRTNMVFTIEPGIYIPSEFGIRIEDMVRVTETGCEILSRGIPD